MSRLPDYPDSPWEDLKKRTDKRIAELEAELSTLKTSETALRVDLAKALALFDEMTAIAREREAALAMMKAAQHNTTTGHDGGEK